MEVGAAGGRSGCRRPPRRCVEIWADQRAARAARRSSRWSTAAGSARTLTAMGVGGVGGERLVDALATLMPSFDWSDVTANVRQAEETGDFVGWVRAGRGRPRLACSMRPGQMRCRRAPRRCGGGGDRRPVPDARDRHVRQPRPRPPAGRTGGVQMVPMMINPSGIVHALTMCVGPEIAALAGWLESVLAEQAGTRQGSAAARCRGGRTGGVLAGVDRCTGRGSGCARVRAGGCSMSVTSHGPAPIDCLRAPMPGWCRTCCDGHARMRTWRRRRRPQGTRLDRRCRRCRGSAPGSARRSAHRPCLPASPGLCGRRDGWEAAGTGRIAAARSVCIHER